MKLRGRTSGGKPVEVECSGGTITGITEIPGGGGDLPFITPGFLDMQVNGFRGSDYSLPDLSRDHILSIIRSLAASGTTQHTPTIVTSPADRILRNLRVIADLADADADAAAAMTGIHIEGPFISGEDGPRGAHDPAFVREPDMGEFREWQAAAGGRIKIVTVAPERKGALDFIAGLAETGVVPAIGHTGADPETIAKAVAAGARLSTHLGNGSYVTLPRLRNYIWEQLAEDRLMAGIISDGFHLPRAVVKVFHRAKGPERLILVSDVALLGGCKPGVYKRGSLDVQVYDDGHLGLPGKAILAGAAHLLDWDIPRFMEFTGASLEETVRLCTVNPARLLGLPPGFGKLEKGSPANLALFRRPETGPLDIEKAVRGGVTVHQKGGNNDD
jgi:N-acetylglucosamine-6-phosphate deacetylase